MGEVDGTGLSEGNSIGGTDLRVGIMVEGDPLGGRLGAVLVEGTILDGTRLLSGAGLVGTKTGLDEDGLYGYSVGLSGTVGSRVDGTKLTLGTVDGELLGMLVGPTLALGSPLGKADGARLLSAVRVKEGTTLGRSLGLLLRVGVSVGNILLVGTLEGSEVDGTELSLGDPLGTADNIFVGELEEDGSRLLLGVLVG